MYRWINSIFIIFVTSALAGSENTNAWPSTTFVGRETVDSMFVKEIWMSDSVAAMVERDSGFSTNISSLRGETALLISIKDNIIDILEEYVDYSKLTNDWFETEQWWWTGDNWRYSYPESAPKFTYDTFVEAAGLPYQTITTTGSTALGWTTGHTNYYYYASSTGVLSRNRLSWLGYTPSRNISGCTTGHASAYNYGYMGTRSDAIAAGYTTSDYGWKYLPQAMNALKYKEVSLTYSNISETLQNCRNDPPYAYSGNSHPNCTDAYPGSPDGWMTDCDTYDTGAGSYLSFMEVYWYWNRYDVQEYGGGGGCSGSCCTPSYTYYGLKTLYYKTYKLTIEEDLLNTIGIWVGTNYLVRENYAYNTTTPAWEYDETTNVYPFELVYSGTSNSVTMEAPELEGYEEIPITWGTGSTTYYTCYGVLDEGHYRKAYKYLSLRAYTAVIECDYDYFND